MEQKKNILRSFIFTPNLIIANLSISLGIPDFPLNQEVFFAYLSIYKQF